MSNGYTEHKFLCDTTVGKLAKLLRMTGLDTETCPSHIPSDVLEMALEQNRTILTRNSAIAEMKLARDVFLLRAYEPYDQLRMVLEHFDIDIDKSRILSRCMVDNAELHDIPKKDVKEKVWPYVYKTQSEFKICPECGRIYWPATHVNAMIDKLREENLL